MSRDNEEASGAMVPTGVIRDLHSAAFQANAARIDPCIKLGAPIDAIDTPRRILVVKARPGSAEKSSAPAFSGTDGDATRKALTALGYGEEEVAWLYLGECEDAVGGSLRAALESIDPESILALDDESLVALCGSLGSEAPAAGSLLWIQGRRLVGVGGFEEMLATPQGKQLAWTRMKLISPEGPVY